MNNKAPDAYRGQLLQLESVRKVYGGTTAHGLKAIRAADDT